MWGLGGGGALTGGRFQRQGSGVLREAVHVVGAREGEVEADGLGALGLRVHVRLESLLPPPFGVPLLLGPAVGRVSASGHPQPSRG